MKRLILSVVAIGLLSSAAYAKTIMAEEVEISCSDKRTLERLLDKFKEYENDFMYRKTWFNELNCKLIGEGMDLKVLKTKKLNLKLDITHKKALLVKLPNGSTAYIAR